MTSSNPTALQRISRFVAQARFDAAPQSIDTIRDALIDTYGCMLVGAKQPLATKTHHALVSAGQIHEHARAIATSRALGYNAQFGSEAKPIQVGFAVDGGIIAAHLAAADLSGQAHMLEYATGMVALMGHGYVERIASLSGPTATVIRWKFPTRLARRKNRCLKSSILTNFS